MRQIFPLISIILLSAFNLKSQEIQIGLIDNDYKYSIEGRVAGINVYMNYRVIDDVFQGYYFYEKHWKPIPIIGLIADDRVFIKEFDENLEVRAIFDGKMPCKTMVEGKWKDTINVKIHDFNLTSQFEIFKNLEGNLFISNIKIKKIFNIADTLVIQPHDIKLIDKGNVGLNKYFLFRVGCNSRLGENVNAYCGGGYEENIVFIVIDDNLNIIEKQSYLINSCFRNRITEDWNYIWTEDNKLSIKVMANQNFKITFDKNKPAEGLKYSIINK